jgi:hypothetical protein
MSIIVLKTKETYVDYKSYFIIIYHNQNYWVFGLFSLSGILGTRKLDIIIMGR